MSKKYRKWRLDKPYLAKNTDNRYKGFVKEIENRGFADDELWSLCGTISEFILPRLIAFSKTENCVGSRKKIKKMIKAFKLIHRDNGSWTFTKEENKAVTKGLRIFSDNFMGLWN